MSCEQAVTFACSLTGSQTADSFPTRLSAASCPRTPTAPGGPAGARRLPPAARRASASTAGAARRPGSVAAANMAQGTPAGELPHEDLAATVCFLVMGSAFLLLVEAGLLATAAQWMHWWSALGIGLLSIACTVLASPFSRRWRRRGEAGAGGRDHGWPTARAFLRDLALWPCCTLLVLILWGVVYFIIAAMATA